MTNLTKCDTGTVAVPKRLTNVNSSRLEALGFISSIVIHNTDTKSGSGRLRIYDAATGASLGTHGLATLAPHSEAVMDANSFETGDENGPIVPTANTNYYNIEMEDAQFEGHMQHLLYNTNSFVVTDMTTVCTLEAIVGN